MKYEVLHSHLMSPDKFFKRGDFVTAKDLEDAGFSVEFLLKNSAIEPLRGSFEPKVETVGKVEKVSTKGKE